MTHSLCFVFKLCTVWSRAHSFKPTQITDTVLVILHTYLMLLSVESFATMQQSDAESGWLLNPNMNHINKKEFELSADEKSIIALQKYYYWFFLQIALFFSYILSIVLYMTCHALSPFTSY